MRFANDHDFPQLARKYARLALRAIEGGFSLLRRVHASTSGAWDAMGRPRAAVDYFSLNERMLIAQLPKNNPDN